MKRRLLIIILLLVLTSCLPKNRASSILTNQVCGKSCWNNIILGETEEDEFLEVITAIANVNQSSITEVGESPESIFDGKIVFEYYRIINDKNSLINISARVKSQRIVLMTFQGDLGLSFQEAINLLGEPDLVSSLWTFDGGINARFINTLNGVEFTNYFPDEKAVISSETPVDYLIIFDPERYEEFLHANILIADYENFILYPWKGYGKIEDNYWPPKK